MQISVTMALDSLKEQVAITQEAKETYDRQIASRDDMIRDAQQAGIQAKQLIRITGLSRERLYAIGNQPSKTYNEA